LELWSQPHQAFKSRILDTFWSLHSNWKMTGSQFAGINSFRSVVVIIF
jgi:hypothetical protein